MMPDETLNYWCDVYVSRRLKDQGVALEPFLRDPRAVLARLDRLAAVDRDAQYGAVHARERRQANRVRQRGPVVVQKLWHGSRKRNRADAPLPSRR